MKRRIKVLASIFLLVAVLLSGCTLKKAGKADKSEPGYGYSKRTVTKALYPETAKHFGVTPSSVERALRTVILSCWRRSDHTMLDTLAGSHLERMPTNTVFLDILASHIR